MTNYKSTNYSSHTGHCSVIRHWSFVRASSFVIRHSVFTLSLLLVTRSPSAVVSFSRDLAPILADKCLTCHQEKKAKGKYRVDTFEQLLKAGDSGDAPVSAGKPDASLLFQRLVTQDEDERMPQKDDPLPAAQVALFKQWIEQGAKLDGGDGKSPLAELMPKQDTPRAPEKYPRPLPVTALVFSDNGGSFWSSGYHEVLEWSCADGRLLRRIGGMPERVLALSVQRGGDLLAVAGGVPGRGGEAVIVSRGSGKIIKRLPGTKDTFLGAAFSPDGRLLALGGTDNVVRVFRTDEWKQAWSAEAHSDWVLSLAFSPDSRLLVTTSRDRTARVFGAEKGDPGVTQTGHGAAVTCASFDADGKTVFSAAADGEVRRWTADSEVDDSGKTKNEVLKGRRQEVTRIATLPGFAITTSADGRVRLYDLAKKGEPTELPSLPERVDALAVDAEGKHVLFGGVAGRVRFIGMEKRDIVLECLVSPGLSK